MTWFTRKRNRTHNYSGGGGGGGIVTCAMMILWLFAKNYNICLGKHLYDDDDVDGIIIWYIDFQVFSQFQTYYFITVIITRWRHCGTHATNGRTTKKRRTRLKIYTVIICIILYIYTCTWDMRFFVHHVRK